MASVPAPAFPDDLGSRLAVPVTGGVSPVMRDRVHHLVETYPDDSLRVVRAWLAEGGGRSSWRH